MAPPLCHIKGYIGLGRAECRPRDIIYSLAGSELPFVLREAEHGRYQVIGDAYVHGIMYGEFVKDRNVGLSSIELC
jgi:hypothetical protein